MSIDVGEAFGLPAESPHQFLASSPWKQDRVATSVSLAAGQKHTFPLEPFEVLTLEALPTQ
jgi:hypothetical protein